MWSLMWRATIFMPIFLVFTTVMITVVLVQFLLPLLIGLCAWFGLWTDAGIYFGIWLLSVFLWRNQRLRALMESPQTLL